MDRKCPRMEAKGGGKSETAYVTEEGAKKATTDNHRS